MTLYLHGTNVTSKTTFILLSDMKIDTKTKSKLRGFLDVTSSVTYSLCYEKLHLKLYNIIKALELLFIITHKLQVTAIFSELSRRDYQRCHVDHR